MNERSTAFRRATEWALAGTMALVLVDGIFVAAQAESATAGRFALLVVVAVGASTPWALLSAFVAGCAARGLELFRSSMPIVRSDITAPFGSAVLLSTLVAMAVALPVGTVVATLAIATVRTPFYAAVFVVAIGLGCLALAVVLALATLPFIVRLRAVLDRRAPALARMSDPSAIAAGLILLTTLAVVTFAILSPPAVFSALPWQPLVAVATGAGSAGLLSWTSGRSARAAKLRRGARGAIIAALLLCGAVSAYPSGPARDAHASLTATSFAKGNVLVDRWLFDLDRDGSSWLYAGGDCDDADNTVSPHAPEVPDNGVDEDCSGLDARSDALRLQPASPRKGRGSTAGPKRRPHIFLVTTDALSYDHTSFGGYERDTTPQLAAFASRSTSFTRAFSASTSTANSLPAILTGQLTHRSPGLLPRSFQEPALGLATLSTLPEMLRPSGYTSIAILGDTYFSRESWPGLTGSFDATDEEPMRIARAEGRADKSYAAAHLVDATLALLDGKASSGPLFVWLHFFDHHGPCKRPPNGFTFGNGATDRDRYDSEVFFADEQWGRLFSGIEARLRPDEYVLFFTSDHGERFDETFPRGIHDESLEASETHVPFLVQTNVARGTRSGELVGHFDLAPTILDFAEADTPTMGLVGESLLPVLLEGAAVEKTFLMQFIWQPRGGRLGAPPLRAAALRTSDLAYFDDYERRAAQLVLVSPEGRETEQPYDARAEWARYILRRELGLDRPKPP